MATKTRSAHHKALCKRYKEAKRYATNKVRKIERHLKKQPNDVVAQSALKAAKTATPSRQNITSCTPKWSREWKEFAHTLRICGHKGSDALVFMRAQRTVYDR